ncbi:hypothetical protein SEVIR_9G555066v4 [Setaria viridis]
MQVFSQVSHRQVTKESARHKTMCSIAVAASSSEAASDHITPPANPSTPLLFFYRSLHHHHHHHLYTILKDLRVRDRHPPPTRVVVPLCSHASFGILRCALQGGHEGSPRCSRRAAGTVRCAANYTPLSPISFVERAAAVYGVRTAVVYGERRHSWRETRDRCVRVAAALATRFGLARGDVVRRPFSCFAYHVCKLQVACESDASTNSQILLSQSCPLRKR